MVKYLKNNESHIDLLFYSMSDSTRRDILKRLLGKSLRVTRIAEDYQMSLPAVSKHLRVLEEARLIKKYKRGREIWVRTDLRQLKKVEEYIKFYTRYWDKQLDNLKHFLEKAGDTNE